MPNSPGKFDADFTSTFEGGKGKEHFAVDSIAVSLFMNTRLKCKILLHTFPSGFRDRIIPSQPSHGKSEILIFAQEEEQRESIAISDWFGTLNLAFLSQYFSLSSFL